MSKILIVDDLPTQQQLMRDVVEHLGHSCVVANDGEQAVEMAQREKPSMILLDVVLPKMDGFQACRRIKKNPDTAHIPVLLVSSKSQESDEFWGMKQGANAYLRKPFTQDELAAAIQRHLS